MYFEASHNPISSWNAFLGFNGSAENRKIYSSILTGKATVLEVEIRSYEKESGDLLCMNR